MSGFDEWLQIHMKYKWNYILSYYHFKWAQQNMVLIACWFALRLCWVSKSKQLTNQDILSNHGGTSKEEIRWFSCQEKIFSHSHSASKPYVVGSSTSGWSPLALKTNEMKWNVKTSFGEFELFNNSREELWGEVLQILLSEGQKLCTFETCFIYSF